MMTIAANHLDNVLIGECGIALDRAIKKASLDPLLFSYEPIDGVSLPQTAVKVNLILQKFRIVVDNFERVEVS
jgi:hypothetical protein